jgi:hypothetical protein
VHAALLGDEAVAVAQAARRVVEIADGEDDVVEGEPRAQGCD